MYHNEEMVYAGEMDNFLQPQFNMPAIKNEMIFAFLIVINFSNRTNKSYLKSRFVGLSLCCG